MMNFDHIIDIETPDGHRHLVTPAHVFANKKHHSDIAIPKDLVADRGDFGFATGRFVQFDDGTNTAFNRNGNMFAPKDYINDAAKLVRYTPLNMLHDKKHVIGTFIGTSIVDPHGALKDAATAAAAKLPYPWIDSLAAVWKYHYRDDWKAINSAFEQGAAFLSMEAVAQTLTCFTSGCPCEGDTYEYQGLRSETYCDALNMPRSRKRLNYPWFVGGAMVVPPALPAWRTANITHLAAALEAHPEQAELVYQQIAATASHLEPKQWEFIMAMVMAGAFADDAKFKISQQDADRLFAAIIPDVDFDVVAKRKQIKDAAQAEADAGELVAAGLAVVAKDSGRVLMLQRAVDPTDPASGMWEFPGGHIEPDENALDAAKREFCEEVGCDLPIGQVVGTWVSPNGIYQGFVWLVESEAVLDLNMDPEKRAVLNPDDPDGDDVEVVAWWDPAHLPGMPALRPEVETTDWSVIIGAPEFDGPDDDWTETAGAIPQDSVNYRLSEDDEPSCQSCSYYMLQTNSCQLVAGTIDAAWVCDLFSQAPGGVAPIEMVEHQPQPTAPDAVEAEDTSASPSNMPVIHVTVHNHPHNIQVEAAEAPKVQVDVAPPEVHVDLHAPDIHVDVTSPAVHVAPPEVHIAQPDIHVATPDVHVDGPTINVNPTPPMRRTVQRDADGRATGSIEEPIDSC